MSGREVAILKVDRFHERTVPALLAATRARDGEKRFLRVVGERGPDLVSRELTFEDFAHGVYAAAAWLEARGVRAGDRVLLYAENAPEWQMLNVAAQLLRAQPVGLFPNLESAAVADAVGQTRPKVAMVSSAGQWQKLAPLAETFGLEHVVFGDRAKADTGGGPVGAWQAEDVFGTEPLSDDRVAALTEAVRPDDVFLILFTSGTTGRMKGVQVGQGAMVHACEAYQRCTEMATDEDGVMFLPYAHIASHAQFFLAVAIGHHLIHVNRRGALPRSLELSPTYVFAVPFVYEKIVKAVDQKLATLPRPVERLARKAVAAAGRVRCDGSRRLGDRILVPVADGLIGRGVKKKLGGNIRALFAGGAATPAGLWRFFESLGIPYIEGFGMSETAAFISSQSISLPRRGGSVGRTSEGVEIRIDDDGELLVRGETLMLGYLDPADSEGVYTEDGFFRTGDLAEVDADGTMRLIGRKKHVIVLSTGKKVVPEAVETALRGVESVEGAVAFGDDRRYVAAAVFVPEEVLPELEAHPGGAEKAMLDRSASALAVLSHHERPQRLLVLPGAPADYPHLLTPSLKIKRANFMEWQAEAIEELYAQPAAAA